MINIDNADKYFADHVASACWSAYDDEARARAVASARKSLSRALGRPLRDDEPPYAEGDTRRDEYAVYEQALHLLRNTPQSNGHAVTPYPVETETSTDTTKPQPYGDEALKWLGWDGASVVRG